MKTRLRSEFLLEFMTDKEKEIASRVESILPALRKQAGLADQTGQFPPERIALFKEAGLLGLLVPQEYGGMGGSLRDLCAATFALGSVCPSSALCFFFHCSTSSRGVLALEAIDAGLFNEDEASHVRGFAQKLLMLMGKGSSWFANFASETVKNEKALISINTSARASQGGYILNGVKSFGCSTGVADYYLVAAQLEGEEHGDGLGMYLIERDAKGVEPRGPWDSLGMRSTATNGIILNDVFVKAEDALAIPASFTRIMKMSKGSFVGNQIAGSAVYFGAAYQVYQDTIDLLVSKTFKDTGRSIAESPVHQELIGKMIANIETAKLWLQRQISLETDNKAGLAKQDVIKSWRLCKGIVADLSFEVAVDALKSCGTSSTGNQGAHARSLRDLAMGLVQAFPSEKGRLEVAKMIVRKEQSVIFGS